MSKNSICALYQNFFLKIIFFFIVLPLINCNWKIFGLKRREIRVKLFYCISDFSFYYKKQNTMSMDAFLTSDKSEKMKFDTAILSNSHKIKSVENKISI